MSEGRDYYEVLGVAADASAADIRRAFRKKAILYHPDNNREDPEAAEGMFQELLEAFEVLSDEFSRRVYDYRVGDRRARFSPRDLARLGINQRMPAPFGAAAHSPSADRGPPLRHPVGAAVLAGTLGAAGIPLSVVDQTAGVACGVIGLAMATGALCSAGTTRLPLFVARAAVAARALAVATLCVSGAGLALKAMGHLVEFLINDPFWRYEEMLRSPAGLGVWLCLSVAAFGLIGTGRTRFSRETQRWYEYRFLLAALGVALGYGLVTTQLAAGVSPEYFYYTEMGAGSLPPETRAQAGTAGLLAVRVGVEYIWKLGLSLGLAVLLANSPRRSVPQLSYRGMFRRAALPLACVVGCGGIMAMAGSVSALGHLLRGGLILPRHRPDRVMAVRGWHMGEFFGTLLAVGLILRGIVIARRKRARQIELDRVMRIQPLLPTPPDALE